MSDIYSHLKDLIPSLVDKLIVIDNKRVFLYDIMSISSGHLVYVPPRSKYGNEGSNIDEVIYLPGSLKKESIGIRFMFRNNLNLQSFSKDNSVGVAISNVIYTVHEFKYIHISKSIIVREVSGPLFPEEEIKIKGEVSNMRFLIESYVNEVLSTYCTRSEQYKK